MGNHSKELLEPSFNRLTEKIPSNRSFGLVMAGFFFLFSIWPLFKKDEFKFWSFAVSAIFLLITKFNENLFTKPNLLWYKLGLALQKIITPIVMSVLFFIVFTPMALIYRGLGNDPLMLKKGKKKSYWVTRAKDKKLDMEKQF